MLRTTITMDEKLTAELDAYILRSGAFNRSEAIRDLVRRGLGTLPVHEDGLACVAIVSFAIDQSIPGLSKRLREARMERHNEFLASTSIPIDHTTSIDIHVMRGRVGRINEFAQSVFLERGVRHGNVALMPITEALEHHAHDDGQPHTHLHLKVQEGF